MLWFAEKGTGRVKLQSYLLLPDHSFSSILLSYSWISRRVGATSIVRYKVCKQDESGRVITYIPY